MSKTQTPLIELDNFWAYQAVVLADRISRVTLAIAKDEAGLNLSQWRVLAAIAEKEGRTAGDVVKITPMDKTIVSRAVASLIELDLVNKTSDQADKRRATLALTSLGRKNYRAIAKRLIKQHAGRDKTSLPPAEFAAVLKDYIASLED